VRWGFRATKRSNGGLCGGSGEGAGIEGDGVAPANAHSRVGSELTRAGLKGRMREKQRKSISDW
jgi:hypothetical protein